MVRTESLCMKHLNLFHISCIKAHSLTIPQNLNGCTSTLWSWITERMKSVWWENILASTRWSGWQTHLWGESQQEWKCQSWHFISCTILVWFNLWHTGIFSCSILKFIAHFPDLRELNYPSSPRIANLIEMHFALPTDGHTKHAAGFSNRWESSKSVSLY